MANSVPTQEQLLHPAPQVGRLGFDDGWFLLQDTFLNLRLPTLLVDPQIIGPGSAIGLEPFGSRNPRQPLPPAAAHVELAGDGAIIRATRDDALLAAHWFEPHPAGLNAAKSAKSLILIVGDTHAIQLSWSALWTCHIGIGTVRKTVELAGLIREETDHD